MFDDEHFSKKRVIYPCLNIFKALLKDRDKHYKIKIMFYDVLTLRGFVDCCWEAKIPTTRKKQEDCPFQLNYRSNFLPSGCAEIINVYFKPRKTVLNTNMLI